MNPIRPILRPLALLPLAAALLLGRIGFMHA